MVFSAFEDVLHFVLTSARAVTRLQSCQNLQLILYLGSITHCSERKCEAVHSEFADAGCILRFSLMTGYKKKIKINHFTTVLALCSGSSV